jgi:hypothetical protein
MCAGDVQRSARKAARWDSSNLHTLFPDFRPRRPEGAFETVPTDTRAVFADVLAEAALRVESGNSTAEAATDRDDCVDRAEGARADAVDRPDLTETFDSADGASVDVAADGASGDAAVSCITLQRQCGEARGVHIHDATNTRAVP